MPVRRASTSLLVWISQGTGNVPSPRPLQWREAVPAVLAWLRHQDQSGAVYPPQPFAASLLSWPLILTQNGGRSPGLLGLGGIMSFARLLSFTLVLTLVAGAALAQKTPSQVATSPGAAASSASADCVQPKAMHGTDKGGMPMPMLGPCPTSASAHTPKAKPSQSLKQP